MTINDLSFLASVFLLIFLLFRMIVQAINARWRKLKRTAIQTFVFVTGYALALIAFAVLTPRQFVPPGGAPLFR